MNNPNFHDDHNFHNDSNAHNHSNFHTVYVIPPERLEDKHLKYICPHCRKEIRLTFHTIKCPNCGGKLDDVKQYYYDYESQQANTFWGRHKFALMIISSTVILGILYLYLTSIG